MQFFLDTASLEHIRRWQAHGLVDGVTTNPALLAREGGNPLDLLTEVTELVDGPVSAQVTYAQAPKMVVQGRALARLAPNIVVKLPATTEGLLAARELVGEGIEVNITLTFQPAQALPFVRLPATYVSLILGRVEDFGVERELVERARIMLDQMQTSTRLLVASLRNPHHVCEAVSAGADVLTVPPSTWELVFQNPLSLAGQEDFQRAWLDVPEEQRAAYERLGLGL